MFHKFDLSSRKFKTGQQGSALVIGVFIITVMFLMASALINILQDADEQVNIEVLGTRAFAAANSGAEAALAQLFPLDVLSSDCAAVSDSWTPPNVVGFSGCRVELTCSENVYATQIQYLISSEATCSAGNCDGESCMRVNRKVEVEARD